MSNTVKVYKSGGRNCEYFITLVIYPSDANLDRSGVVNKDTAKYRCRKAFVVEIQHKDTKEFVNSICSNFNPAFIYKTGSWSYIYEREYDDNKDNVCSNGIHFFTTKEPAFLYGYIPKEYYNKVFKSWHDSGQLEYECEYKNGILDGPYKEWYEDEQLMSECEYKNGKQEGLYKEWYSNGQLCIECVFKNGVGVKEPIKQ